MGNQRRTDSRAQPATSGRHEIGEDILREQHAFSLIALLAEDLADLECVITQTALERDDGGRIVGIKGIVAAHTQDPDPAVQRGIVIDTDDFIRRFVALNRIEIGVRLAVQHGHIGRPVRVLIRQVGGRSQQEDVIGRQIVAELIIAVGVRIEVIEPEDGQFVDAIIGKTGVKHIDHVVALIEVAVAAERINLVVVAFGYAVQCQGVFGNCLHRRRSLCIGILQIVDDELVLAVRIGWIQILAAISPCFRTQVDIAGCALAGRAAQAGLITELNRVNVGITPHPCQVVGIRYGRPRVGATHRIAGILTARRYVGVRDDTTAKQHHCSKAKVEIYQRVDDLIGRRDITINVDRLRSENLAVFVEIHVIADAQQDAAIFSENLAM